MEYHLWKIDKNTGYHRTYSIFVRFDMLEDWVVSTENGRKGHRGKKTNVAVYTREKPAIAKGLDILVRKKKDGYIQCENPPIEDINLEQG